MKNRTGKEFKAVKGLPCENKDLQSKSTLSKKKKKKQCSKLMKNMHIYLYVLYRIDISIVFDNQHYNIPMICNFNII